MKNLVITAVLFILAFTSCQQKQFAHVQKGKIQNFESPKQITQNENSSPTTQAIVNTETTAIYSQEVSVSSIAPEMPAYTSHGISENEALVYDSKKIDETFEKLTKVEAFVNANERLDATSIKETNLVEDISLDVSSSATLLKDDNTLLGIPSFLWGCVLGGLGIILVYIFTEDKEQTKKALYGCLTAGGVIALVYIVLIILGLTTSFS